MNIKHNFLDNWYQAVNTYPPHQNTLLICIKTMLATIGLPFDWSNITNANDITIDNIQRYERDLGIILYPVSVPSIEEISNSVLPVLICIDTHHKYFVYHKKINKNHRIFNPLTNTFELWNDDQLTGKMLSAWQLSSVNFPLTANYLRILKSVTQYFPYDIFRIFALGVALSTVVFFISIFSSYIFNHIHEMHNGNQTIVYISLLFFLLASSGLNYINDTYIKSLNIKITFLTMPSVWSFILNLPVKAFKDIQSGDFVQRVFDYELTFSTIITLSLSLLFGSASLLFLMIYLFYCNALLTLFYLMICFIFSAIKLILLRKNLSHITAQFVAQGRLSSFLNETLLQIHKIRSSGLENEIYKKWMNGLVIAKRYEEKSTKLEILGATLESLLPISLLISCYIALYLLPKGSSTLHLLAFMICAGQFLAVYDKLSSELIALIHLLPALKRMEPILSQSQEVYASTTAISNLQGSISLANVSFKQNDTDKLILDDISIHIEAGAFVALVGPSGAGKSTIFNLLLGFATATSGSIMIDNENINHLNMQQIRKHYGVVLQTTNIFPGTIFSNIAANTDINLDDAYRLARYVGLDADIDAMPMKMHTYISDNSGESISGGQKQKILIARALATQPKILLLDEATSALDNNSQAHIYANLKKLNITRIVIAHRYSTIKEADRIYVLDKGKIIDSGKYQALALSGPTDAAAYF